MTHGLKYVQLSIWMHILQLLLFYLDIRMNMICTKILPVDAWHKHYITVSCTFQAHLKDKKKNIPQAREYLNDANHNKKQFEQI